MDRDVNAAMVLSLRGLARLASSLPHAAVHEEMIKEEKGLAGEAMKGNPMRTAILIVDASKGNSLRGFAASGVDD